jgi:peptide/nickel transport system permease protein
VTSGLILGKTRALLFGSVRVFLDRMVTLLGLAAVTFAIGRLLPADPVLAMVGDHASPETYNRVRLEMGLDQPVYVQFGHYVSRLLRGDLGSSFLTGRPVLDDLLHFFPATLELSTIAIAIGSLIGIPLGVLAASRHRKPTDYLIRIFSLSGYSIPIFWLGLLALLLFYLKLGWVAGPGRLDVAYQSVLARHSGLFLLDALLQQRWDIFANALSHLLLPAALLGYFSAAYIIAMTRSFMLEQLSQEYITTARVKGVGETAILWRHALPNAASQLVTVLALAFALLLEGAVLTETVFAWPGLGLYVTQALFSSDLNAVLGGALLFCLVLVLLNTLADRLGHFLDPRGRST